MKPFHSIIAASILLSAFSSYGQQSKDDDEIDCKQQQESTIGMKMCAAKEEEAAEKILKQKQLAIRKPLDKASRAQFDRFTKAAAKYKEELCAYEGEDSKGGTIYGLVVTGCYITETERQIKLLDAMANPSQGK